jgi:hypothetical protein
MIEVHIEKPIYGNFVFIRDMYIKQAQRAHDKLHIRTPKGEIVCTPEEWLKGAKKMEKRFKYPEPMILFGKDVPLYPVQGQTPLL